MASTPHARRQAELYNGVSRRIDCAWVQGSLNGVLRKGLHCGEIHDRSKRLSTPPSRPTVPVRRRLRQPAILCTLREPQQSSSSDTTRERIRREPKDLDENSKAASEVSAANPSPSSVVSADTEDGQWPSTGTALFLLNTVAIIWGSQHAVIKLALDGSESALSPSGLSFLRFAVAAAASLPFTVPKLGTNALKSALGPGLELGFWMFAGYAAQAVGLLSTTASRSGFLVYLNVKFVPVLAAILYGRKISVPVWASAAMALVGTALLGYDGNVPPNVGDAWSIAAAAASAMFILRLESAVGEAKADASALNAVSLSTVALLSGIWLYLETMLPVLGSHPGLVEQVSTLLNDPLGEGLAVWGPVLYLGLVTSALSNWIQAIGQRRVAAEKAAVIYAMDPVYGAVFSFAILGEQLGALGILGAAIITLAAFVSNKQASSDNQ